jgi:predicted MFS family arabinose efflux permease
VLLAATVTAELATPRLVHLAGYRLSLAAGLFLPGAPALALLSRAGLAVVVAVNMARGVGFAITTVAGGALTASLIPAQRRGEGLGLAGIVGGVPAIVCLPAGVWIAARWGCGPVFAATAGAALLALGSVPGLPRRREQAGPAGASVLAGLRDAGLVRLAGLFCASAMAAGVLVTFLPLSVTAGATADALLTQAAAATAGRWVAGRIGDRHGQDRLLVPGVLACATGMAALAATRTAEPVACAAGCSGLGFGASQNSTRRQQPEGSTCRAGHQRVGQEYYREWQHVRGIHRRGTGRDEGPRPGAESRAPRPARGRGGRGTRGAGEDREDAGTGPGWQFH